MQFNFPVSFFGVLFQFLTVLTWLLLEGKILILKLTYFIIWKKLKQVKLEVSVLAFWHTDSESVRPLQDRIDGPLEIFKRNIGKSLRDLEDVLARAVAILLCELDKTQEEANSLRAETNKNIAVVLKASSGMPANIKGVNGNGSKQMGRIGLLCHGSNLHRFGIGSNGLGSTLKNANFKRDNILISTQVHSTQFDLSQFDLSYSTKRVDLILFDLFHSTHFMQSILRNWSKKRWPMQPCDRKHYRRCHGLTRLWREWNEYHLKSRKDARLSLMWLWLTSQKI